MSLPFGFSVSRFFCSTDDLELFLLKGYGNTINYWMGVPLLRDIFQTMEEAIRAKEEYEKIQKAESLDLPPKSPQKRNWTGSSIAPFAGNCTLVLYQCHSKQEEQNFSYHVQVLHNEALIPLPACGTDFCPFEVFKERIVHPLLKHEFKSICDVKNAMRDVEVPKLCSWSCKFSKSLSKFFTSAQPQQEISEF